MKHSILVLCLVVAMLPLLGGCFGTLLENRLMCTLDGKQAHTVSKWGRNGISSEIAEADAVVACAAMQAKAAKP